MSKGKFLSLIFFVVTLINGCVAQPQRPVVQTGRPSVAQRNVPSSFGERREAIASGRIKEFLAAMEARGAAAEAKEDWRYRQAGRSSGGKTFCGIYFELAPGFDLDIAPVLLGAVYFGRGGEVS